VRNYIGRASVDERLNKPADALSDYQKVLSLDPADKDAAAAVVRISSAMTKAAIDLAAKQQQPSIEKKAEPVQTQSAAAKDQTNSKSDTTKQPATEPVAEDATRPVNAGNLMTYCTDLVKPTYPPSAMALRTSGDVTVNVMLDADGHVIDAKATSGNPSLRGAAEIAAKRSKFKPVTRNGKPVTATGIMSYTFKL